MNWIFYELRLKCSWIGINDNWIWDLIINVVNWDGNVLIIIELDKINKFEIAAWYGHYGIHSQYNTIITHGGCRDIVLDAGSGDANKAIEDYGVV